MKTNASAILISIAVTIWAFPAMGQVNQFENHRPLFKNTPGLQCRYAMQAPPTVYAAPSTSSKMLGYISKGVLAQDGAVSGGWVPIVTASGLHGWVPESMTSLIARGGFSHRCHVKRERSGRLVFDLGV